MRTRPRARTKAARRIADFAESIPESERDRFFRDLIGGYTVERVIVDFEGKSVSAAEFARAQPRFTIWVASLRALALIYHVGSFDEPMRQRLMNELTTMKPLRSQSS